MAATIPEYVDLVEEGVALLRQPHLAEYWKGERHEAEWGGRSRIVQDYAFIYAALHVFTGEASYLERAVDHLVDFGGGDHFASILCGGAYELVGDDMDPDQRESFARNWVADAEWALDQYVGDEDGVEEWDQVSNHAIAACFYADYACHLFPDEGAEHDYSERTDAVWEAWWDRREFHEQASNYEGFTESFLAKWAGIRGAIEEFYATPSVRNMFERNMKIVSPGGIVAPYGDSGYHQHQCKWIAMFEKVASDTGDGRFQEAALDVASYFEEHVFDTFLETVDALPEEENVYNGRLIFKNHLHELAWLALAALWHDGGVDVRSRPEPTGRVRRLPYGYVLEDADVTLLPDEKMVENQIALAGGAPGSEARTYLLLSVGPELVHDHADASAIQLLSRDRTVHLGTNGYLQRELLYHNAFYAQPSDWDRYPEDDHDRILNGDESCRGTVDYLRVGEESSHCRVTFDRFHGMPLEVTREVMIDRRGDVTLIDRARAREDGYAGGPLFHAESVRTDGDGVYRLRTDELRSLGNIVSHNPPGELVVDPSCRGTSFEVVEPAVPPIYERSYREFPTTEYKKIWRRSYAARNCLAGRRDLPAGEEVVFVTRLLP